MRFFANEVKPTLLGEAVSTLDASVKKFIDAMVERHEVDLTAIREQLPQYFGMDGRNLVVQRIAHLRNLKQATRQGTKYAQSGSETR
jgi:hypothetical protein